MTLRLGWLQIMQMSALILRQHFCCASFYFLSWFLFLQILTGFLFKFLLSVVANFLTPFLFVFLLCRSLAPLRTFLSNQQMLLLPATSCVAASLWYFWCSVDFVAARSATNMKANLHNNFCQIFVSFGIFCCRNWSWNCLVLLDFVWLWLIDTAIGLIIN